jgi:hypothetical protein
LHAAQINFKGCPKKLKWTKCLDTPNFAECSIFGDHTLTAHNTESSIPLSCGTDISDFSVTAYSDHKAQIHRVNSADCNDIVHMAPQNMSIQSAYQYEVSYPENKLPELYSQLFESQPDTKNKDYSHHNITRQKSHIADFRNNYNGAYMDSNTCTYIPDCNRSCSEHVCKAFVTEADAVVLQPQLTDCKIPYETEKYSRKFNNGGNASNSNTVESSDNNYFCFNKLAVNHTEPEISQVAGVYNAEFGPGLMDCHNVPQAPPMDFNASSQAGTVSCNAVPEAATVDHDSVPEDIVDYDILLETLNMDCNTFPEDATVDYNIVPETAAMGYNTVPDAVPLDYNIVPETAAMDYTAIPETAAVGHNTVPDATPLDCNIVPEIAAVDYIAVPETAVDYNTT